MRFVLLLGLLTGCFYEDRYEMTEGPPNGLSMADHAWSWYGQTEARPYTLGWIARRDCGYGFTSLVNGACVWGEYAPTRNKLYLVDQQIEFQRWTYLAETFCHETVHAVIDVENGTAFDDGGHDDYRFAEDEQILCRQDFDRVFLYSAK